MNSGLLIGPLVGILGLLIGGLAIYAYRNSAKRAQSGLPGDWQPRVDGTQAYQLKFRPARGGKNKQPSMLSLRVASASEIDLQIKPEGWFDRFAKNLGIAREFQTGDRKFDDALYLRGEVDYRVGMALKQTEMRASILSLFQGGCTELRQQQRWLQVDWIGFDPAKAALPGPDVVARMAAIAAALPPRSGAPVSNQTLVKGLLWSATAALGVSALLGLGYAPLRWWPMWRLVIPAAVLTWLLLAWIAAWLLRGHSRSHDHWGGFVAVSLVTSVVGSLGLLCYYNGHFDPAPAVVHQAPLVDRWTTRHKSRTTYHLGVDDWLHPGQILDFHVDADVYADAQSGLSILEVRTGMGRLGVEWLQGYGLRSPER